MALAWKSKSKCLNHEHCINKLHGLRLMLRDIIKRGFLMNKISYLHFGLLGVLALTTSGYCGTENQSSQVIDTINSNNNETTSSNNIHDFITGMSAAFQTTIPAIQTGCIIKGTAKICLESDEVSSIPNNYQLADFITLPAFVQAIIYSKPDFSGDATTLPLLYTESTTALSGLNVGSIKLLRHACLYSNLSYRGSMICDHQDSGLLGSSPIGFNSLKVASGIWIDVFENSDQSGFHLPYTAAAARLVHDARFFLKNPLSYKIHSQNEAVDLVKVNANTHNLEYQTLGLGGKIMDFSTAGYMGGGVPRPTVLPVLTISPPDDPSADAAIIIQKAIDQQSKQPLINGFRNGGSILLSAGNWNMSTSLLIKSSGIVLQGDPNGGTVLIAKGSPRNLIQIGVNGSNRLAATKYAVTDAYLPLGAERINLDTTNGLNAGDRISIQIPITSEWIALLGMDKLTRDGESQVWITPGRILSIDRVIKNVDSNTQITLDSALPQPIDAVYTQSLGGASVRKYSTNTQINQVGLEHIQAQGAFVNLPISQTLWSFASFNNIVDSWMEDVSFTDFGAGAISLKKGTQRITLNNLSIIRTNLEPNDDGYPADIDLSGSQILIRNAFMYGPEVASNTALNYFFVVSSSLVTGPNVVLNMKQVAGNRGSIQPHMRWSSGLLIDNAVLPNGDISFMNRGNMGSGQGWAIGYGVIWNSITKTFINQTPPGVDNYAVGVIGEAGRRFFDGNWGTTAHMGKLYDDVPSLYLYQLNDRLGLDALKW